MSAKPSPVISSPQLSAESRWLSDHVVRVAVIGEIDLVTAALLRAGLLSVISTGHPQWIEVDLSGVPFLDCSGLGVLVVVRQAAARAGCHLRIADPQPIVRRVLEMTGLLGFLTWDPAGPDHVREDAGTGARTHGTAGTDIGAGSSRAV
jgi:anti-anti-sigma factor